MSALLPVNVNPISGLWTALFLLGIALAFVNSWDARRDRDSVLGSVKGRSPLYRLQAFAELLIEIVRFGIQLIGLALGVNSFYIPPYPPQSLPASVQMRREFYTVEVVVGLLAIEVGQIAILLIELWRRREARKRARAHIEAMDLLAAEHLAGG